MNISEKIELINNKIQFWENELEYSRQAVSYLYSLGNEIKIEMNDKYIKDIELKLSVLKNEALTLTNQG